jgi:hypothetical protein
MRVFGLVQIIDKSQKSNESIDFYNSINPDAKIMVSNNVNLKHKAYLDFLFTDTSVSIGDKDYLYTVMKNKINGLKSIVNKTSFETDELNLLTIKLQLAKDDYDEYMAEVSKYDQNKYLYVERLNMAISRQNKYALNLEKYIEVYCKLLELEMPDAQTKYFENLFNLSQNNMPKIYYLGSVIKYLESTVNTSNHKIIINDELYERVNYIVFESDTEPLLLTDYGDEVYLKISTIIKLYTELKMDIPNELNCYIKKTIPLIKTILNNKTVFVIDLYKYKDFIQKYITSIEILS